MPKTQCADWVLARTRASSTSDGKLFVRNENAFKTAEIGQYEGGTNLLRKCAVCPECYVKPILSRVYGFICPLCGRQRATLEEWNGKPEQLRLFR